LTLRDAVVLVNNGGDPAAPGQSTMPSAWASQLAGSFGSNDTIQFDSNLLGATQQTIILNGSELYLSRSITSSVQRASQLAISGNLALPTGQNCRNQSAVS
jgi:hypothetical protein